MSAGFEGVETVGFFDSDSAFNNLGLDSSDFLLKFRF
jgi:hypothetical protein